jgi:hypothetical protein
MLNKKAKYTISDFHALNSPDLTNSFFIDQKLVIDENVFKDTLFKIAKAVESSPKTGDGLESEAFDLQAEIKNHPDSLFVKCYAIKADEPNDNGDCFSRKELIKATPTFVGVPVFTNHQNTDINQARGKVIHSWWDDEKNGIMIIARVDAIAYPQLARGVKEQYVTSTSMGAQVQYSLCSVCHNHAETPDSYCGCIRERKTRTVSSKKLTCKYFDHGPEKECPLCGSTKDDIKKFAYEGKVFEHNYGIKFIENSFVTTPACHDCGVTEVIDPQKFLAKVAAIQASLPGLLKAASEIPLTCTDQQCIKIAGQQELDSLNQALDLLSSVSQSMLNQKEQIDLEFLSDLVKVLADLQTVTDELNEQGYGRLQSPGQPPKEGQQPEQMEQGAPEVTNAVQPVNPTPGGGSKIHSGPAGQVGSVTSPLANTKRILLEKVSQNLLSKNKTFNLKPLLLKTNHSILKLASYSLPKKLDLKFQMKNKNFLKDNRGEQP